MAGPLIAIIYALLLIGGGYWAYSQAPEGANATTALAVPLACAAILFILSAIMLALRSRSPKGARRSHIAALIFALLFMFAFTGRAIPTYKQAHAYREGVGEYNVAVNTGEVDPDEVSQKEYLQERDIPDHDKSYLANTLFGLTALSTLAALGLFVFIPKKGRNDSAAPDAP